MKKYEITFHMEANADYAPYTRFEYYDTLPVEASGSSQAVISAITQYWLINPASNHDTCKDISVKEVK